jgi:competence protein ComEC
MILTHPHSDHVAGLTKVLDRYKVDKVMHGDVEYSSSIYNRWESSISDPDIDEIIARKPQTVRLGEDCILKILYPRHDTRGREDGNLNNSSLVSSLDCRGAEFLFTGDIESAPKKELVNSEIDLDADVLKVAHHGAGQTVDGEFIERVSPEKAVVSVGENDHGHPNERYLEQLRKEDIEVFRTDKQGAIIFTKNEEGSFIDFGAHSWKDIFY